MGVVVPNRKRLVSKAFLRKDTGPNTGVGLPQRVRCGATWEVLAVVHRVLNPTERLVGIEDGRQLLLLIFLSLL